VFVLELTKKSAKVVSDLVNFLFGQDELSTVNRTVAKTINSFRI